LLLMFVGGWVLALFEGTRRSGLWLGGTATLLLVIVALFPVGQLLLRPLENRFPEPELPAHVDGIIVLGGGQDGEVTASRDRVALNDSGERLIEAVALFRRYPDARRVFTGGNGPPGETESDVARRAFAAMGIDPASVTYEARSASTWDNAVLSRELVRPGSGETWLLVTSAWHMPRAVGCFRMAGWRLLAYPVDYRTSTVLRGPLASGLEGNLRDLDIAAHEYLGLLAYRLEGRIASLFPSP
jgi:uncharacterized SAM-binding protein YcdF (DUF218 family)